MRAVASGRLAFNILDSLVAFCVPSGGRSSQCLSVFLASLAGVRRYFAVRPPYKGGRFSALKGKERRDVHCWRFARVSGEAGARSPTAGNARSGS